ncbi:MAG: hypothetical protein RLO23_01810 [Alphaproteobacteria bacterium]
MAPVSMLSTSWDGEYCRLQGFGILMSNGDKWMMNGMEGMGWGMGLVGILVVVLLVLGIAALTKYLFLNHK